MLDGGGDRGQDLAQPLHLPAGRITSTRQHRVDVGQDRLVPVRRLAVQLDLDTDAVGRLAQDPIRDPYPAPLPCQRA